VLPDDARSRVIARMRVAQDAICAAISALDGTPFRETAWDRPGGGGGWSRVLEGGPVVEKGGVNVSAVHGALPADAAAAMRERTGRDGNAFFATGLSLVIHPRSPRVPIVHANWRFLEIDSGDWWFGGGSDLTPCLLDEDDARHFHGVWKAVCDRHAVADHGAMKRACDRYFTNRHRGEARGVGGIFFDDLTGDFEAVLAFVSDGLDHFCPAWLPLAEQHHRDATDEDDRLWQLRRRSRYAEFNLVWDRGTLFGLRTDARVESVLMSLPPLCRWDVDVAPRPGTDEERLVDVLRNPRDWV
jgi:coproporphyrinogen III oxidase